MSIVGKIILSIKSAEEAVDIDFRVDRDQYTARQYGYTIVASEIHRVSDGPEEFSKVGTLGDRWISTGEGDKK